jgi:hypothetical protein
MRTRASLFAGWIGALGLMFIWMALHPYGTRAMYMTLPDAGERVPLGTSYQLFLPSIVRRPIVCNIQGSIRQNGAPAASVELVLFAQDGSRVMTTTTGIDGSYLFADVQETTAESAYSVHYINTTETEGRLREWVTAPITSCIGGNNVALAAFDIAEVIKVSPEHGVTVELPVTFNWLPRQASSQDSYTLILFEAQAEGEVLEVQDLGYVGSATIQDLPSGFDYRSPNSWYLLVEWPDGSFGVNLYSWSFSFIEPRRNSIHDITFSPPSPATLRIMQPVNITFSYSTNHSGGVRMWAVPYSNGERAGAYTGSNVYSGPGEGTVTRSITVFPSEGETVIDEVRFELRAEESQQTLFDLSMPVNYTFTP